MTQDDLTIADVLKDPLIRLMMRADRVSVTMMRTLLVNAARAQAVPHARCEQRHVAKTRMSQGDPLHPRKPGNADVPARL